MFVLSKTGPLRRVISNTLYTGVGKIVHPPTAAVVLPLSRFVSSTPFRGFSGTIPDDIAGEHEKEEVDIEGVVDKNDEMDEEEKDMIKFEPGDGSGFVGKDGRAGEDLREDGFDDEEEVKGEEENLVNVFKQASLDTSILPEIKTEEKVFGVDEILDDESLMYVPTHELEKSLAKAFNEQDKHARKEGKSSSSAKFERKIDEFGRAYGTGKRKRSVARVWIKPGDGSIEVNKKNMLEYFPRIMHRDALIHPFVVTDTLNKFDVWATAKGGGISGQVGAVRLGIARALLNWDPTLKMFLKKGALLKRDPRIVEEKKFGRRKARKSFTWVKR